MTAAFKILFEAHDARCVRSYRIEAGPDLFGDWLVTVTFGRNGSAGRPLRFSAPDEAAARRIVRRPLRRRAGAPWRIGVPYVTRQLLTSAIGFPRAGGVCGDITRRNKYQGGSNGG